METKSFVVVCGAGFATSTIGQKACQDVCKELGFKAKVEKRMATAAKTAIKQIKPDLVLVMSKLNFEIDDVPFVNGIPLVTGKGKDEVYAEMKKILLGE